jgi:hypothetical protein
VMILTFEFEHISRLLFKPLFFILKANQLILNMEYFSQCSKVDIFLYLDTTLNSIRFEGMRDEIRLFWIMIKVE